MTRHPFDSDELGRNDPEMDRIGTHLERYAADVADEPPMDMVTRIQAAVDEEPVPAAGSVYAANLHGDRRRRSGRVGRR